MGNNRGPDDLDEAARARLRRRLLDNLPKHKTTFGDRLYSVFSVLAAPAPHLIRAAVSVLIVTSVVATATVASADALPDEPLYGLKLASEELRLALVASPEDRAAVELSRADHRLAEAERLAVAGRASDAIIASGAYGAHLANAAAALAGLAPSDPRSVVVIEQLQARLAAQQRSAEDTASRIGGDSESSAALAVLSSVAPSASAGAVAEGIAAHAAAIASQAAVVAQRAVRSEPPARPAGAPVTAPRVSPSADAPREEPKTDGAKDTKKEEPKKDEARPSSGPTAAAPAAPAAAARPEQASRAAESARQALERVKQDAERAQEAAEKAKQAAKDAKDKENKKGGPGPRR